MLKPKSVVDVSFWAHVFDDFASSLSSTVHALSMTVSGITSGIGVCVVLMSGIRVCVVP